MQFYKRRTRSTPLPREIQDTIIDNLAGDVDTLLNTCLVNKAWRVRTCIHLHSKIFVRATACKDHTVIVDLHGVTTHEPLTTNTNPRCDFKTRIDSIPSLYDLPVTDITLTATSERERMEHAIRGIQCIKPTIYGCIVTYCLTRFKNLKTLTVDNVDWVDCPDTVDRCTCLEHITKRSYRALNFRNIDHRSVLSNIYFITCSASTIDYLCLSNVTFDQATYRPYTVVPTQLLSFAMPMQPWDEYLPDYAPSTLRGIEFDDLLFSERNMIRNLLQKHKTTLEHVGLRPRWFTNGMLHLFE
ncbi:hypothetical protein EIP86_005223 [Pleurotus ostreatoroseus]|nr:hypothetical protein EIP86_005223 [Pleurotus ostreatoroseus]